MSEEPQHAPGENQRRLAAIVFTDVAGYSARMQQDETGTLALVRADFAVMRELCTRHGGEVLKSTGDGLLLCFSSVVQAVACSLMIQTGFSARPTGGLQHRIGIHLGDMFREGEDVVGDGVNIAARLQTKARPGTLCLSQSVYDAVKGKVAMQVEPLGPQSFKNIAQPITVWLATPAGSAMSMTAGRKSRAGWLVAAVVAFAAGLAMVFWPKPALAPAIIPDLQAQIPDPVNPSQAADKSIAVLPFTNMSEDKENAFFADGIHEDILTSLANIADLKVIARTSVMQYRDTRKTIRQIGGELGVAYVLEGSVRRSGNTVRVTGQLIEVRTEGHVWAQRYDREFDLKDVFSTQAALATQIVQALHAALTPQDLARLERPPTDNLLAYDLYLKGRAAVQSDPNTTVAVSRALPLLESAVQYDPKFARAWLQIGLAHFGAFISFDGSEARRAKIEAAFETADRLDPDNVAILVGLGNYLVATEEKARARALSERLVRLFPNHAATHWFLGQFADLMEDDKARALVNIRQAYTLDPRNRATVETLRLMLDKLRLYDESEALARNTADLPWANVLQEVVGAMTSYRARGSTEAVEKVLARQTPEALRTDPFAIRAQMVWGVTVGDADRVIRLWEAHGLTGRLDAVGAAYLAKGQPEKARPLLEKNRDQKLAMLATRPKNRIVWFELALTQAMLGDKAAALEAHREMMAIPGVSGPAPVDDVVFQAWLGDKDQALDELARLLPTGKGLLYASNVHMARRHIFLLPLQGDPRFEAILNDPRNNAPLL